MKEIKVRDLRKKDQYKIDDAYLNGYARLCGVYATAVYNSLSRHADFHTQECFPSIESISEQHNIDKKTVIKAIKTLEEWGIVIVKREKDTKTKRQLPNVYILTDKSNWKPKPIIRVDEKDSESRVDMVPEPSGFQGQSRVDEKDHKDNTLKDNTIKDIATHSVAGNLNDIITLFKDINPSYERLFSNKTQRDALNRLIKKYGDEKVRSMIRIIGKTNGEQYAPTITTPAQLEENLGKLVAFLRKNQNQKPIIVEI